MTLILKRRMLEFQWTVNAGTIIHALIMVIAILLCYRGSIKALCRIEDKQDALLDNIKEQIK